MLGNIRSHLESYLVYLNVITEREIDFMNIELFVSFLK